MFCMRTETTFRASTALKKVFRYLHAKMCGGCMHFWCCWKHYLWCTNRTQQKIRVRCQSLILAHKVIGNGARRAKTVNGLPVLIQAGATCLCQIGYELFKRDIIAGRTSGTVVFPAISAKQTDKICRWPKKFFLFAIIRLINRRHEVV